MGSGTLGATWRMCGLGEGGRATIGGIGGVKVPRAGSQQYPCAAAHVGQNHRSMAAGRVFLGHVGVGKRDHGRADSGMAQNNKCLCSA